MWKGSRKQAKKDTKGMVNLLRRFIAGESILSEVLQSGFDLSKLSVEQLNELAKIDDPVQRGERYKAMTDDTFRLVLVDPTTGQRWNYLQGDDVSIAIPDNGRDDQGHGVDEDSVLVDGRRVTMQEYEQIVAEERMKGNVIWVEKKTYPDKDIPGIEYVHPESSEDSKPSEAIAKPTVNRLPVKSTKAQEQKQASQEAKNAVKNEEQETGERFIMVHGKKISIDEFFWQETPLSGWINRRIN